MDPNNNAMIKLEDIKKHIKPLFESLKEHHILPSAILFMATVVIWRNFETVFLDWFNKYILPLLKFENTVLLRIVVSLFLCVFIFGLVKKWRSSYVLYVGHFAVLLLVTSILSYYRVIGYYDYLPFIGKVAYVDMILSCCILLLLISIVNTIRRSKKRNDDVRTPFYDQPIKDENEDLLDFNSEAKRLADYIQGLGSGNVWSIGITAPWGAGKTSFLNLTKNYLSSRKHIVINFNPRNSKSVSTIQEDFFSALNSSLARYSSALSSGMKDYMAALNLIDNRNVFQKAFSIYKIWDRESSKKKVNNVLKAIPGKVIVIIDDFDRLLSEEIVEVFKILDSNAAFCNMVFLTAYDKEHVQKVLGSQYINGSTDFSDKFFNYEKALPIRPYTILANHFERLIFNDLTFDANDSAEVKRGIEQNRTFLEQYASTMRDIKRAAQLLVEDYKQVEGEVNFKDFMLVELIKYKYPCEHEKIFKMSVFETPTVLSSNDYLYINNDAIKDLKSADVLHALFPSREATGGYRYRRVNERKSFYMYFVGYANPNILLKDMRKTLNTPVSDVKKQISEWYTKGTYKDFTDFIDEKSEDYLHDVDSLKNYVSLLVYLASFERDRNIHRKLFEMVRVSAFRKYRDHLSLKEEDYKGWFTDAYKEYPDSIGFFIDLRSHVSEQDSGIPDYIFNDAELKDLIYHEFDNYATLHKVCDDRMMMRLYGCVDYVEPNSRKVILDKDRCTVVKNRILNGPEYYIDSFLRLGMISSNPNSNSAACEPFWRQIFLSPAGFEEFLNSDICNSCLKIKSVREFWEVYKANDYKQVEFSGYGNSQSVLKDGFSALYHTYQELKSSESQFDQYRAKWQEQNSKQIAVNLKNKIDELITRVDDINLYIKYHGTLRNSIAAFSAELANYIAHASDVKKGEVERLDFVRIRAEYYDVYKIKTFFAENVFMIEQFIGNDVRLDGFDELIPISELEYIPIDGESDRCIYYDPVVAASIVLPGQPIPVHHTDYSYYMEALERTTDEKGIKYSSKVSKFEYVHQVQHFLRKRSRNEDLKIHHSLREGSL